MKLARPDLAAYGIVALCLVLIAALSALGHPVSDVFQYVAVTALGIGGGVALQAPQPAKAADPAADPAPAAAVPAPRAVVADPTTGIIPRVASHAP